MNIVITRYRKKTETIDGSLTIDGMHICDTAENAQSAIQPGIYNLKIMKCKQYARKMPVILLEEKGVECAVDGNFQNPPEKCSLCPKLDFVGNNTVMPFKCPMIKPGNGVYHRLDCSILVGTYLAPGCLARPRKAFGEFYERIRKSAERGHCIRITIREKYD